MKLKNRANVKLRIWEYFCVFSVALLIIIWLLQVMFLQYYYTGEMARETLSSARKIVSGYEKGELDKNTVNNAAYNNNIFLIITDDSGNVINANDAVGEIDSKRINRLNEYVNLIGDIRKEISKSEKKEVYYRLQNDSMQNNVLLFGGHAVDPNGNGAYIYVISQLEPIDSVTRVLQRQFVIITVIALLFALSFAYLIARRFSQPVEKLTRSARELALGNTEVSFENDEAFGELKELSKALDYAASEISKSAQLRQELMANVSHDLRTPLTMIKMYAEMIRDLTGDNKEKREKNLNVIIEETDRLSLLVNDILELSRCEATGRELDVKAFDICKTITTILDRFAIMEEYHFELESPEKVYVLGDENRIEQVLYNLIGNAVTYTGEDKRVIIRVTKKFDHARVEIMDTGEGIPQDELASVWDRYYRAKTHIRSKVGTGLGLSIVKTILIAHNADFGIESTIGFGSNFWFELKFPENSANKIPRLADNSIVSDD